MNPKEVDPTKAEPPKPAPPPADLIEGEALFWKMADVKGIFTRRVVTGYLITNFRCFVWDAEVDEVMASVPVPRCEAVVSYMHKGVRTRRGGRFMQPPLDDEPPKVVVQGELTTIGDVSFKVDDKTLMVFREIAEPEKVKRLVDILRLRAVPSTDERMNTIYIATRR